eukprot:8349010-Alexandrium_andersonii.AAC.1
MPGGCDVMRLAGLWRHGNPVEPGPVASAGRPPRRTARAGDGEAALGQPGENRAGQFDFPIVTRLGQVGLPVARDQ